MLCFLYGVGVGVGVMHISGRRVVALLAWRVSKDKRFRILFGAGGCGVCIGVLVAFLWGLLDCCMLHVDQCGINVGLCTGRAMPYHTDHFSLTAPYHTYSCTTLLLCCLAQCEVRSSSDVSLMPNPAVARCLIRVIRSGYRQLPAASAYHM